LVQSVEPKPPGVAIPVQLQGAIMAAIPTKATTPAVTDQETARLSGTRQAARRTRPRTRAGTPKWAIDSSQTAPRTIASAHLSAVAGRRLGITSRATKRDYSLH